MSVVSGKEQLPCSLAAASLALWMAGCASAPADTKVDGPLGDVRIGATEADEGILRQIRELEISRARQAGAALSHRQLGALTLDSTSTNFSAAAADGRVGGRLMHHASGLKGEELRVDQLGDEWDASLEFDRSFGRDRLRGRAGGNFRDDDSLPYGQIVWEPRFSPRTRGRFELYVNEISEDSPALRAIGAKDKVSAELTTDVTARESATIRLTGQHYHTREQRPPGQWVYGSKPWGRVCSAEAAP